MDVDESVEDERRSWSMSREFNRDELIIIDKINPIAESRSLFILRQDRRQREHSYILSD